MTLKRPTHDQDSVRSPMYHARPGFASLTNGGVCVCGTVLHSFSNQLLEVKRDLLPDPLSIHTNTQTHTHGRAQHTNDDFVTLSFPR